MGMGEWCFASEFLYCGHPISCDGFYENPLALGPCKLVGPVGTLP